MMPVFHVGDLVKPNPGHWSYEAEHDIEAMGVIIEMRSMMHMRPEARVMWNDVPGHPAWTILDEVLPIE
jgi:hypothetical protein